MLRLATWVDEHREKIDRVTVTMDHHHRLDIAHPASARYRRHGVGPFTLVLAADVAEGRIPTAKPQDRDRALKYLQDLEKSGRPPTWSGRSIARSAPGVRRSMPGSNKHWMPRQTSEGAGVTRCSEGENPGPSTTAPSAPEIPLDTDPATGWNWELVRNLEKGKNCLRGRRGW
ncbi:MAG: hypothetical protein IPN71_07310 [Fibrobacteres bacterium]|nr:hypothetical protein [Fibrobacterota bacterium]